MRDVFKDSYFESIGQSVSNGRESKVFFVFSGQGHQWYGMARRLLITESLFQRKLMACEAVLSDFVPWSLTKTILEGTENEMLQIDVLQPVLFSIQVALADMWMGYGVPVDGVLGHSMGEVAAAHIAGSLSLEDSVKIICTRSKLLKLMRGMGCMAVVELDPSEIQGVIDSTDDVSVASVNGPRSVVISGATGSIKDIVARQGAKGVDCHMINVDVASHSSQMDFLLPEIRNVLSDVRSEIPLIPFYSTVTGDLMNQSFDVGYWADNLRKPVMFWSAIKQILSDCGSYPVFLEISSHPVLSKPIMEALDNCGRSGTVLPSLHRELDDDEAVNRTLSRFAQLGLTVK